ncbi:multidrug-resistance type transporter aminotriazole resistance [Aphanomyces cochlioides]|nr:multidrug-resistance type transporter aminotriazole resistance [Aphanomyces cochlioides]
MSLWKNSPPGSRQNIVLVLNRMVSKHHLTWKQLLMQYPERTHVNVIELFLPDETLNDFLSTFLGSEVNASVYAKENASQILPHLIITKNMALLQAFAKAHGGGATIASLVGENILSIVKEMLMQKVTSFNNVAEWEFFFGFIPKDVGIRDIIQHKPLTIIYALAWELAGDRPKVAKKSFMEVCKQFLDDEENGKNAGKFHISQQFFLAVMTFLGQKLLSKSNGTCIRAIQCTNVLLSLFDTIGDLDNFVPKIMATLKLASQDAGEEKLLAACQAWKSFVRLLSPEAIKANFWSIFVSLLPCIGTIPVLFKTHVIQKAALSISKESQKLALEVLKLICSDPSALKDPSVMYLLSLVPPVVDSPQRINDHQPIHEVIQQLLPLMQHWDGGVREVGLLHLIEVLNSRCREVQDLILSLDEGLVHTCIMAVLKELLQLSRLETQETMQVLVAQALGALGAIDMARITPQALRPDTTSELSTKNLACHLIQSLLVKELRAAPQNTDVIALSIQQILQFLAQLNTSSIDSSASTAPSASFVPSACTMPEWMQRQFHSKGVDKIIAPYWSTKYQAPNFKPTVMPASSTFYESFGSIAYDQWLVSWCKFLIDQSTHPERNIFLACRRALTISLEMARFLLPYLVQNVLKQPTSYDMVKREIISVLQEDSLDSLNDVVSSHHHQCAQTVFSMLDELNDWVWASQRRKIALSQQAHISKHLDEIFDQEKEVVEEFLKDIPLSLLSSAAFKIKAYARAIQYFESHLRQHGGTKVKMSSSDISKMQQMYGSLEEPDALLGLAIQRRWLHPQPTGSFQELMNLIAEHEHLARWEDALACYEQAIHHIHGSDVEVEIRSLLYSGVIQCMIQLGRLEGALQHVRGIVNQYPEVIPAVYPCALECAWRLSRWDLLAELTTDAMKVKMDNENMMGMKFARAILCFHQDNDQMQVQLKEARLAIIGPLAAASQESYQRVYPLLHQLHFLHELEQGFCVLQSINKAEAWNLQCPWNRRNATMAPALKYQEPILALRRVMIEELQLDRGLLSENWLQYAKMARKEGLLRTAESAVMHAQALGNRNAIIEQAKLMVERGKIYEALHVLEPIPVDISLLKKKLTDNHFHAKTLLLATNYMQQSSQKQGQHVIERYKSVIEFDKNYAKGYFCMAKYYEVLLENDRRENEEGSGDPYAYLPHVLQNYVLSLKGSDKYLFQSLPRLLTLWYEFGEILQSSPKRTYRLEIDQDSDRLMQQISKIILDALHSLPESMWLVCFPQVTSRICHPNATVVEGVKAIMVKVLITYPQRAMWYILGLAQSLNTQRKTRAIEILKVAQKQLSSSNQVEMANVLTEGMRLVEELIKLAEFDPGNQKKMPIRLSRVRAKVLLPIQNMINRRDPDNDVYIKSFSDKADVMLTKEKPKRIQVQGTDGRTYAFLCKREKHGDLRKDARMMEFNALMNKLLQRETDGRKRKLRLRTYAVICLNEESGLMEWVPNTRAMRHLISQIYKTEQGFLQPVRLTTEFKDAFLNMQKQYAHDVPKMTAYYKSKILTHPAFTPRFHQWFLNNFSDPTAWYEARDVFVRSAAVWSMVGHIVGLGDRHGENILIDCTTGECVHVDFDCLFDKGLKLARPEIVPFRLTPNMVDAFGLSGVEGVYRHTSEVTLTLLRANRETLRSVLESFVHDPLVEWGRSKNKQVMNSTAVKPNTNEQVNSEAKTMLKIIDDRLRGVWNLGKKQQHETLPLSVKGQVDRLIAEATSDENLAQMYIGWMPFL